MRTLIALAAALSTFATLSACGGADGPTFEPGDWRAEMKQVRLGLRASEDDPFTVRRWEILTETLAEATGLPVRIYEASDYNGIIQAIASGQIDIATFGAGSYANAYAQVGDLVTPILASRAPDGSMGYYSGLVVRSDTPYQSIADLAGEPLAFVDFNSTSGYIYPRWKMRQQGIDPDTYFGDVAMAGGHLQAVMAMQNGQFDAAIVSLSEGAPETGFLGGAFYRMARQGLIDLENFRLVWHAGPIPRSPTTVRSDRPQEFQDLARGAIAALPFDAPGAMTDMGSTPGAGYGAVDHSHYAEIVAMREMEIAEQRSRFVRRDGETTMYAEVPGN